MSGFTVMDASLSLDAESTRFLQRHGFDEERFLSQRELLKEGGTSPRGNAIEGEIAPPLDEDLIPLGDNKAGVARGEQALRAGEVGALVLAGGMATRFGGVVKAEVEALDGLSFLQVKVRDIRRLASRLGCRIPIYVMASFATQANLEATAAELTSDEAPITVFGQFISVRLRPDASIYLDQAGKPSFYATGHGDLPFALKRSGLLARFEQSGGKHLFMSNVDNLAATLDPAIIGLHIDEGRPITAEVVEKLPGDKGGAPAWVDGALQIVEAFRFPEAFDQDSIRVFNTNTFTLTTAALDAGHALSFFDVRKKVSGEEVVQFERLIGQLTAFEKTTYAKVSREGRSSRFEPAKDPDELERRRSDLRALLRARGVID